MPAVRAGAAAPAPYPASRLITGVRWSFSGARPLRKANGSDIWPCTWALDDALYCAFGDGGGFDGNDDHIGRVSLGFARVTGAPRLGDPASYRGRNVWGAPPYAECRATFGGKIGSLIAVDGVLYGAGGLWTHENARDPVATNEAGTLLRLVWSSDLGRTWQVAPWEASEDIGSFLQFGRDGQNAPGGYIYDYFVRPHDATHVYLRRIPANAMRRDPNASHADQYLAFVSRTGDAVSWSPRKIDAVAVFTDPENMIGPAVVYDAGLGRYLMTIGHDPSGRVADASPGQLGVFEAPHPWGPWRTIYYSDTWGRFPDSTRGDFLGLTFPSKWISADGRTLWGVYSGPGGLDAFNLVRARLRATGARAAHGAPELLRCTSRLNAVNGSIFMHCGG